MSVSLPIACVDAEIRAGSRIKPDGWEHWMPLREVCDGFSRFRLPTPSGERGGPIESLACSVDVTGRTVQSDWRGRRVRVRVRFLGDGEPATVTGGWMYLDQ